MSPEITTSTEATSVVMRPSFRVDLATSAPRSLTSSQIEMPATREPATMNDDDNVWKKATTAVLLVSTAAKSVSSARFVTGLYS